MISNDFFKRIEAHRSNQLPFVIYRKPHQESIHARLQNNDAINFVEDFTEKGFVFSPFEAIEKTVLIPESASEVLSRKETINLKETKPISIFKRLLNHYKSAFVYCWYHPKIGLWLGATPETLVKIEDNRFSIMALAGTQDYNGSLDVIWENKEKQEQQFVTDFIIDNLKPSVDDFKVSDVETVKAGNLVHLKTMISATLKPNIPLKNVIEALHPTPAVCGLPKGLAKEFILKHENYNREFYTGFLGELNLDIKKAPRSGRRNIENRAYAITKKSLDVLFSI